MNEAGVRAAVCWPGNERWRKLTIMDLTGAEADCKAYEFRH